MPETWRQRGVRFANAFCDCMANESYVEGFEAKILREFTVVQVRTDNGHVLNSMVTDEKLRDLDPLNVGITKANEIKHMVDLANEVKADECQ